MPTLQLIIDSSAAKAGAAEYQRASDQVSQATNNQTRSVESANKTLGDHGNALDHAADSVKRLFAAYAGF